MNDAPGVCRRERIGDLRAIAEHEFNRQAALQQSGCERFAFHQFHYEKVGAEIVQSANVRMVQCGDRSRFALEPVGEPFVYDLNRNQAVDARISRFVHFAHAALANGLEDLEMVKPITGGARHTITKLSLSESRNRRSGSTHRIRARAARFCSSQREVGPVSVRFTA